MDLSFLKANLVYPLSVFIGRIIKLSSMSLREVQNEKTSVRLLTLQLDNIFKQGQVSAVYT